MKISVIIPAYNRSATIARALRSVFNQTFRDYEIIVVDDASCDNTAEVIKQFAGAIIYHRHEQNRGGGAARNTGLKLSHGEFVAFLDSDDEWSADKLRLQLEMFEKDDQLGLVYSGFSIRDASGTQKSVHLPELPPDLKEKILVKNFIGGASSILARRECFLDIGGFDETLKSCQDWDVYIRMSRKHRFGCLPLPLVNYFQAHDCVRISHNRKALIQGHERIMSKHAGLFCNLPEDMKARCLEHISEVFTRSGAFKQGLQLLNKAYCGKTPGKYWQKVFHYTLISAKVICTGKYGYL